ncbi:helix-turn-helix transcriptional regulator [Bosea sp. TAB14]|jgi:AraC-like DNA-binding protein|uniref:helix-turn-helix transcriptional regulator n=1 Tax=Bosea sp. TAB14 TaxID=3237481 RepID=UPI003F91B9F7
MDVVATTQPEAADAGAGDAFSPFWLMSDSIAEAEARAIAHKILGRVLGRRDLRTEPALPFGARCVLTTRPDIGLMSCFEPAARWLWPVAGAVDLPRYVLVRPADGRAVIEQGERRLSLRAREAAILDLACETRFRLPQLGRIDLIALDTGRLPALASADAAALMRPIPRGNRGLQVLAHYGALLLRGLFPLNSAALRDLAIGHIHDLVDVMMTDSSPPGTPATADKRAGRLMAIKADIEVRLERRDLSLEMIAGLHGVTPRAIQKSFEAEGRAFSEYVLERRLERAWLRLVAADEARLSISGVAFEVGFGDLSYFNRSFRKRFGCSPSQAKAGAAQSEVP